MFRFSTDNLHYVLEQKQNFFVKVKVFPVTSLSGFVFMAKMWLYNGAKPRWSGDHIHGRASKRAESSPSELPVSPAAEMPGGKQWCQRFPAAAATGKRPVRSSFLPCSSEMCGGRAVSIPYGSSKVFSLQKRETSAISCLPFASRPWACGVEKCVHGKQGVKLWCRLCCCSESLAFRQQK